MKYNNKMTLPYLQYQRSIKCIHVLYNQIMSLVGMTINIINNTVDYTVCNF